ncbi:MAG: flagellar basal body P-ring formation chaperone FlgA [Rhodothermales bacterium]
MRPVPYIAMIVLLAGMTVRASADGALNTGPADDDRITERVQTAAEAYLAVRFPDHVDRLRVRVVRLNTSLGPEAPLRLDITSDDGVPRGHTQARLHTDTGSGSTNAGWAVLYVTHFDSIAVARSDLSAGDRVAASDIGTAWIDVTTFRGRPLNRRNLEQLRDDEAIYAVKRITSGDILRDGDLRPPLAVDTGEQVTLTYRRGPIHLTMTCRARRPGVVGDVVRLYNESTQSTYKARLTGRAEAEWIETL